MSDGTPVLAVVGHVNKGKSSVVSTLTEDDSVVVSRTPGTTAACRTFPMRVDGETLFTLVDTPGFEQARHVLAWLKQRDRSAVERHEVLRSFLAEPQHHHQYPEECELLRPILDGAGILYVVDGSRPYSSDYECEMEILRWTGQPRMALINPIGGDEHLATWQRALDQYFRLVRVFNAHGAHFDDRVRMLEALRELDEQWRPALDHGIDHLRAEGERRRRHSARTLADLIGDMLTFAAEKRVGHEADPEQHRASLERDYKNELIRREQRARKEIEELHQHLRSEREEDRLELVDEDLFGEDTWLRLGLDRRQLVTTLAVGGLLVGGGLGLALGGLTALPAGLLGGAIGGAAGWFGTDKLAQMQIQGLPLGGKLLTYGPARNPQFPWVLLDRGLLHYVTVCRRAHARREQLKVPSAGEKNGLVHQLGSDERGKLQRFFDTLRKKGPIDGEEHRRLLAAELETLLGRFTQPTRALRP